MSHFYLSKKTTSHLTGARPAGRGNKSPNLTIRERVTLFGCAVLVVGSLILDAVSEWRKP